MAENSHAQRYCEENRIPFEIDPQSVGVIHEEETAPQDSPLIRSGEYRYILRQDGSAAIITADIEGDCVLPSELDGHPVTAIGLHRGDPDFEESYLAAGLIAVKGEYSSRSGIFRNTLTGITIPAGVETIGNEAFESCDSLICVVVKNSPAHQYCVSNGVRYEAVEAPDPFAGFRNPFDGLPDPLAGSRNP